ncbi:MAG: hypothetical protein KUL77_02920 [Thermomonas sp.]|uniref:hypothetical protein n=1 Tax=Thermomonas sp. TaxID=1971895 RepID=UPI001EB21184|nr:hypothetical protein [Thermomonas sp.]MBV2208499.1 hypothetical protein [Thermomonas sp.]
MTESNDPLRVNARFDRVAEERLRYIVEHTGMNVSDVLKESVAQLYARLRAEHAAPFEAAQALGLVGGFAGGDPNASENVKQVVAEALRSKLSKPA